MKIILSSRRHHYVVAISVFLIMLIMVTLIAGMVACGGGSTSTIHVRDWYELSGIRYKPDCDVILMNDLDSTTSGYEQEAGPTANEGKGWQPIQYFAGTFDGQGYEIRDLFVYRPEGWQVGLFGASGGVIINIGVVDCNVTGSQYVGGLAGTSDTVSNCYATGTVTGDEVVGGLVGWHTDGTVTNCYATANVAGNYSGGLVGVNGEMWLSGGLEELDDSDSVSISASYSTGSVTGSDCVGGLVGENYLSSVSNSHSSANVTGESRVGGLVGFSTGDVIDSYATGSVTGTYKVGGLVGRSWGGPIIDSYSTGSVTGSDCVGGLVGENYLGTVSNSYYNYDEVLINGENIITIGALFGEDFEEWLTNDKFLDVNERLSQESGYYVVNNVSDFKQLLAFGQDASLNFRLKNDLDFATEPNFYIPYLAGEFDGSGHNISNLSFNFDFVSRVGLFGYLASGGKVNDVGAENVNITADRHVGGLVGENVGTVSDSYSTGSTTAVVDGVGGLMGSNWGTVSKSYSTNSVTGNSSVGGLIGHNYGGTVSSSFWDTENSGQSASAGGTGKTTAQMKNITTFSAWNIIAVANSSARNASYIWNIVDNETYPFLS